MQSLFSAEKSYTYLGILYNDEPWEKGVEALFDATSFDRLQIATFVSSPKHFFRQTAGFETIELLLGIEENAAAEKFLFDPDATEEMLRSLDKESLRKIGDGRIAIRFTEVGTTIHSKIYILTDTRSGKRRVVVGSANFSGRAFGGGRQFEELVAYDSDYNPRFVDHFVSRYETIRAATIDFIPPRIRKKLRTESLELLTLSDEESVELLKERIGELQGVVIAPDELSERIKTTKRVLAEQEASLKKEIEAIAKTKTVIEIVTRTAKGESRFLQPARIAAKKEQIITRAFQRVQKIREFTDSRVPLLFSEAEGKIFIEEGEERFVPFARPADKEVLREQLTRLGRFIAAYTDFTVNDERETPKRIFEAILFSFCSVYIWRWREEAMWQQGRDEIKSAIPLFMLIAGMAQSGKTHLVTFISRIMGNHGQYYHYVKQAKLSSLKQINPQIIHQFFNEETLTPIFVDEITKEYYSSASAATSSYMGESFVKNITNAKSGRHPCMIATSNTDFSANSQVMRRMYYIQLNNPFDSGKKEAAAAYFNDVVEGFGTELYRDFLYRLEKRFDEGIAIDIRDILKPGREIFLEWFDELSLPIPDYFSSKRIDDYYLRGRTIWRDLYNMKHTGFKELKKENLILLDDETVFGTKLAASREKKELLQYLPIGVAIEEKGIVRLNYEKFFEFIGMGSKNSGFFGKIFG
ncbi:phospholipase D family protein [Hydrogenimonas sp.]